MATEKRERIIYSRGKLLGNVNRYDDVMSCTEKFLPRRFSRKLLTKSEVLTLPKTISQET